MWAQISDNNPYSRFGIGEINNTNFSHLQQMGDLGASYADPYHINIVNPATLANLRTAAFDVGLFTEYSTLSDGNQESTSFNGNLAYLSLAFPLKNPVNELFDRIESDFSHGMAFTIMPHSTVGYNIRSTENIDSIGSVVRDFTGSGGTYKFLFSNGFKYKNFSAGINLGYLFGKIRNERSVEFSDIFNVFGVDYENNYSVKGFLWNLGLHYSLVLNQKEIDQKKGVPSKVFNFGLYGNSATRFSTSSNVENFIVNELTGSLDTVEILQDNLGNGKLPAELGLGATYFKGNKWALGVNYSITFWNKYRNDANPETLTNANKLSLGGYFRPNYKSFDKYFERVMYRFGAYYNNDPRSVNAEQLNNYGVTFGFGMPFVYQKKISHANIGFNIGKKGGNTPIRETFYRLTFGFTFNDDEWFIKRKYY